MKKNIYYQIHKSNDQTQGSKNNGFTFPFFKRGGGINGTKGHFNKQVECFVLNDKEKRPTGHGGIFLSKVPYRLMSLNEVTDYNDYIGENVSLRWKFKFYLNKYKMISWKKQNEIISKIEYLFGLLF